VEREGKKDDSAGSGVGFRKRGVGKNNFLGEKGGKGRTRGKETDLFL